MTEKSKRTLVIVLVAVLGVGLIAWWSSDFSLDFMRFFAAEPGPAPTATPAEAPVSGSVSCSPASQGVAVGAAASFTTAGGENPRWFAPDGSPDSGTGAAFTTTYDTAGTKKVTVLAGRTDDPTAEDTSVCTVTVTP